MAKWPVQYITINWVNVPTDEFIRNREIYEKRISEVKKEQEKTEQKRKEFLEKVSKETKKEEIKEETKEVVVEEETTTEQDKKEDIPSYTELKKMYKEKFGKNPKVWLKSEEIYSKLQE